MADSAQHTGVVGLRRDEPMASHTSWRAGGRAERFYQPRDLADLTGFLQRLDPQEPLTWVGLGSNLLVRDGGLPGTVIATAGRLAASQHLGEGRLRVEVGAYCARVARFCAREGLTGAEFLAGIPGTMGGALAMNAGAFGAETWDLVTQVQTIDRAGTVRVRPREAFRVGYRSVVAPAPEWFVGAELGLERGETEAVTQRMRTLLRQRGRTQPTGRPSCGSVFRNPPGDHAARLIDAAGLKGSRIGGAEISTKHANFIINLGTATAADIEALIEHIEMTVERVHGVRLVREVRIVGERLRATT